MKARNCAVTDRCKASSRIATNAATDKDGGVKVCYHLRPACIQTLLKGSCLPCWPPREIMCDEQFELTIVTSVLQLIPISVVFKLTSKRMLLQNEV